jgi:murein DD-endopeptidase MepM/ murein hydrolase activator NlpD
MKRWTVMLIPQDRGGTQTFSLAVYHFWIGIGILSLLAFSSAFFFQRHQAIAEQASVLQQQNKTLQWELAAPAPVAEAPVNSDEDLRALEESMRREYEANLATITAELTELLDMEAKARAITGIAPREKSAETESTTSGGGQGGAPSGYQPVAHLGIDNQFRPPHIIYGMSRPSADLILQEIRVRQRSLSELVVDGKAMVDKLTRIPSIWPLVNGAGKITSRYGYRRDPFHRRVRHHAGTDVAAPTGTKVHATAKGTVTFAEYDQFYGNLIKVDHGEGLETWYAHLSKISVGVGDVVERSTVIGNVGSTGRSTGPHLHYEVHVDGQPVDSEKYLTE